MTLPRRPSCSWGSLGVAVVASLAVGAGFQDHPHTYFGFPIHDSVRPPVNGRHTNACVRWTSGLSDVRHDMMGLVNGPAPAMPGYAGIGLFAEVSRSRVVCVRPRGGDLASLVEDCEVVRRALALDRWVFWGMSGGSFVGQVYAELKR